MSEFLEKSYISILKEGGYIEVDKICLPDGKYAIRGGGYQMFVLDRTSSLLDTGYSIVTLSGVRGMYNAIRDSVIIRDGVPDDVDVYKIMSKSLIDIRDVKLNDLLDDI